MLCMWYSFSYVSFLRRVKAFEEKLSGYNKEVEAFRKKEVSSSSLLKKAVSLLI